MISLFKNTDESTQLNALKLENQKLRKMVETLKVQTSSTSKEPSSIFHQSESINQEFVKKIWVPKKVFGAHHQGHPPNRKVWATEEGFPNRHSADWQNKRQNSDIWKSISEIVGKTAKPEFQFDWVDAKSEPKKGKHIRVQFDNERILGVPQHQERYSKLDSIKTGKMYQNDSDYGSFNKMLDSAKTDNFSRFSDKHLLNEMKLNEYVNNSNLFHDKLTELANKLDGLKTLNAHSVPF